MYVGYFTSVIFYDQEQQLWVWYDRKDNQTLATSSAPQTSLLLGVHEFDFSEVQQHKCAISSGKVLMLKMTTCKTGQFTCNDGQCIEMEQRCDQTSNCKDESDEDNCRTIIMKDNYNKKIAPFTYDTVRHKNIPVTINVSMSIIDILKIEEVHHKFMLKFRLSLEWFDFRVKYYNLKKDRSSNAMSTEEVERLWIPFLVFENTDHSEATEGTKDTELTLTREGEYITSDMDQVEEINIFEGQFNRITFEQIYTKQFECVYDLVLYPFDTQVCTVNLIVRKLESSVMSILPSRLVMEEDTVLTQYIVKNWTLTYINIEHPARGIKMELVLKRRIMNSMLTIYLPTVLVLSIVYATNFFKPFFFEAVVTVNLTSLLVLTTLFISVSGSLPKTAYIKLVDVWLIFSQLVPWVEVLLHTAIDMLREEDGEGREVNHHGRSITVGGPGEDAGRMNMQLTQVDEEKKVKSLRDFYASAVVTRATRLAILVNIGGKVGWSPLTLVCSNLCGSLVHCPLRRRLLELWPLLLPGLLGP